MGLEVRQHYHSYGPPSKLLSPLKVSVILSNTFTNWGHVFKRMNPEARGEGRVEVCVWGLRYVYDGFHIQMKQYLHTSLF